MEIHQKFLGHLECLRQGQPIMRLKKGDCNVSDSFKSYSVSVTVYDLHLKWKLCRCFNASIAYWTPLPLQSSHKIRHFSVQTTTTTTTKWCSLFWCKWAGVTDSMLCWFAHGRVSRATFLFLLFLKGQSSLSFEPIILHRASGHPILTLDCRVTLCNHNRDNLTVNIRDNWPAWNLPVEQIGYWACFARPACGKYRKRLTTSLSFCWQLDDYLFYWFVSFVMLYRLMSLWVCGSHRLKFLFSRKDLKKTRKTIERRRNLFPCLCLGLRLSACFDFLSPPPPPPTPNPVSLWAQGTYLSRFCLQLSPADAEIKSLCWEPRDF